MRQELSNEAIHLLFHWIRMQGTDPTRRIHHSPHQLLFGQNPTTTTSQTAITIPVAVATITDRCTTTPAIMSWDFLSLWSCSSWYPSGSFWYLGRSLHWSNRPHLRHPPESSDSSSSNSRRTTTITTMPTTTMTPSWWQTPTRRTFPTSHSSSSSTRRDGRQPADAAAVTAGKRSTSPLTNLFNWTIYVNRLFSKFFFVPFLLFFIPRDNKRRVSYLMISFKYPAKVQLRHIK